MKIILASNSPRRRDLMSKAGLEFEVIPAECEEIAEPGATPADTVVAVGDTILGKPRDREDAFSMLKALSGREHCVYTGVALLSLDQRVNESFVSCTKVKFYDLTDREIEEYINTGEPFDKAGAYGIQGKGGLLVEGISGDYNNVVGLPVAELVRKLSVYEKGVRANGYS